MRTSLLDFPALFVVLFAVLSLVLSVHCGDKEAHPIFSVGALSAVSFALEIILFLLCAFV